MWLALRRVVALTAVLLGCDRAAAQPSVAPPPHPALGEVVAEYQRLGFPLPPADAELVRVNWWREQGQEANEPYFLAFRSPPAGPHAEPTYYLGTPGGWSPKYVLPALVERVKPTRLALQGVSPGFHDWLCLAVQCEVRGWGELARALYHKSLEDLNDSPIRELRKLKWGMLEGSVHVRGIDRAALYRQLKPLADVTPPDVGQLVTHPQLLRHLELTIAPRRSKPGTDEALIDDLVDYWHDNDDRTSDSGREAYWKLVERGFDAVPALLDHLDDERYTYALVEGFSDLIIRPVRVGDLAGEIIYRLAGGKVEGEFHPAHQRGVWLDPKHARAWWNAAKQVNEEKWVLDRIGPVAGPGADDAQLRYNENMLRLLGAKYPDRLRELYLAVLARPRVTGSEEFVGAILASKLARADKLALFEKGVRTLRHIPDALRGLSRLDKPLFQKHLLATLRATPELADVLTDAMRRTTDSECWAAFAAACRKQEYQPKVLTICKVGGHFPWARDRDPIRAERLRFLLTFLDDATPPPEGADWRPGVVQDVAAIQLAGLLGFKVRRDYDLAAELDQGFGPLTRVMLRAVVAITAERELARLRK